MTDRFEETSRSRFSYSGRPAFLSKAFPATGDQGFVLFNPDAQTVANLPVPDGFTTVANLDAGTVVCCLAMRKVVARAQAERVERGDLQSGHGRCGGGG